ncbi:Uncharacterized protein QTN25_003131 [Entamoeba marina]
MNTSNVRLELIYLMNVVLYFEDFKVVKTFAFVNKKCSSILNSMKINPPIACETKNNEERIQYVSKILTLFPSIQTIEVPNVYFPIPPHVYNKTYFISAKEEVFFASLSYLRYRYNIGGVGNFGTTKDIFIDDYFTEYYSNTIACELFYNKNDIVLSQLLQLYVYSRFGCQFFVDNYNKLISLRNIHLVLHKTIKDYDGICYVDVLQLLFKSRNIKVIHLHAYEHIMDDYVVDFIKKCDCKKIVLHYYKFNEQYETEYIHLNALHNVYCIFHTTRNLAELVKNNFLISKSFESYIENLEIKSANFVELLSLLEHAPYSVKHLIISAIPLTSNLNLTCICPLSLDLSFFHGCGEYFNALEFNITYNKKL